MINKVQQIFKQKLSVWHRSRHISNNSRGEILFHFLSCNTKKAFFKRQKVRWLFKYLSSHSFHYYLITHKHCLCFITLKYFLKKDNFFTPLNTARVFLLYMSTIDTDACIYFVVPKML